MASSARIRELDRKGWPAAAIAAQVQCSWQQVAAVLGEAPSTPVQSGVDPAFNRGRQRERRRPPDWSPEEVARLRALYASSDSLAAVVAEMGRPYGGVHSKALSLGLRLRSRAWTEEETDFLRRGYAAGDDPRDLARALGRPVKGLQTKASTLGLKHGSRRPWTEADRELLRACHRDGVELSEATRRLGRGYAAVAKIAEKMGLSFKQPAGTRRAVRLAEAVPVVSGTLMLIWLEAATARLDKALLKLRIERARRPEPRIPKAVAAATEAQLQDDDSRGDTEPSPQPSPASRARERSAAAPRAAKTPAAIAARKRPAGLARVPLGLPRRGATAPHDDQALIERAIAEGRVTRCPTAAVDATTATIPEADRAVIAVHGQARAAAPKPKGGRPKSSGHARGFRFGAAEARA